MELKAITLIPLGLELLAAIFATVYFKKYRDSSDKFFVYFLWYTFLLEITGRLLEKAFGLNNIWLYNAFTITSFLFYFYWFINILNGKTLKKIVIIFAGVFLIVAFVSLYYESWLVYHKYAFIVGALFVLVLTVLHFYQLLRSDEVLEVRFKLSFWISTGLLLFYMGMIPLFILSEYMRVRSFSFNVILISLNVILYSCYIIGFIWTKKKYNRF